MKGNRKLLVIFLIILSFLLVLFGTKITGLFFYKNTNYECKNCNVLMITIDTLRYDHLSSYGYFQETTPYIDIVAKKGIRFSNAFSQMPHTPPSHWSMFTGLYPYKHKIFFPIDNGTGLTTLSAILSENGYVTSGFTSSRMLDGFNNEFDYFNWYNDTKPYERFLSRRAKETSDRALAWLENYSKERFFMWIHYFDPHSPYDPLTKYDIYNYSNDNYYANAQYDRLGLLKKRLIRDDIAKYDGEIRYVDENIGIIMNKFRELNLENNTLVIILSDHGECFGEHNFSGFGYKEKRPCVFHGKTLYDEEVHIPLIINNPDAPQKGITINTLVESVDIFPTILDILRINYPENDGESLVSLIENGKRKKNYVLLQTRPRRNGSFAMGIRTTEWKFIITKPAVLNIEHDIAEQEGNRTNVSSKGNTWEIQKLLFDVRKSEKENLINERGWIASELEQKVKNIISDVSPITIDNETEEILKSFGYIA